MPSISPQYTVTNWSNYNKHLVARGGLTLWIESGIEEHWYSLGPSGKRGRSNRYSDRAIEICLQLRAAFNLTLRSTQGFVDSLFCLMQLPLRSPDYSRLSRRSEQLKIAPNHTRHKGCLDLVVDSTGLKIYGEGEWKVRAHGADKRRTWKKLHLAVDPLDHEVMSFELTENSVSDDQAFSGLIESVDEAIGTVKADGAYDKKPCYDTCFKRGITLITPPNKRAKPSTDPPKELRNRAIERIYSLGGDEHAIKQWKYEADYHTRSLSETAMSRFKTLCGDRLRSRKHATQQTETAIKISILNTFTKIAMPTSTPGN